MKKSIEATDCMLQAIASVTEKPDVIELLRTLREEQLNTPSDTLDIQTEVQNLLALFLAIGENVTISLATIHRLVELDELLEQGEKVLLGLPQGQSSQPPHIVHVQEKYSQQQIIEGDKMQIAWAGYRSAQQYISTEELNMRLMEQKEFQLFLVRSLIVH